MNWRIYRLPGSREIWHIDSGCGTQIFNVRLYSCAADTESVDIGEGSPRAWILVKHAELHIVNGKALFIDVLASKVLESQAEEKCAAPLA